MDNRAIAKSAIADFLDELLSTHQVFAPVKREGILGFELLSSSDEVVLDSHNTRQAPKEVFFPRSETLFTYQEGKITPVPPPEEQRVVFGIRPCDARSAILLDKVFDAADYQDPYYANRRRNTVLIGLACSDPLSTCFCTVVGGGPFSVDGLDLLWADLGDRYLVETVTERGEALIADSPHFRQATQTEKPRSLLRPGRWFRGQRCRASERNWMACTITPSGMSCTKSAWVAGSAATCAPPATALTS
jgi:sulfhydrogenase subunit beta (sulfur reductase)